jgi:glycosyltransferase involved in cell wall biosynthesis
MAAMESTRNPIVSVIIPVYNGESYLSETIASVLGQTENDWEIVAVNDGSTDDSQKILAEYAIKYPGKIRVIQMDNGGVSRARNTGVSAGRGTFIAFIDQDDLWRPKKLERQIRMFSENDNLGISFTNESVIDSNGTIVREKVFEFDKKMTGNIFEQILFDNFIPISSVMIRRSLFLEIGGFDPQYSFAEDYDFLLRAAQKVTIDCSDEPLLLYREHSGSWTYKKIDKITTEANLILDHWRVRNPHLFRDHPLRYFMFRLKFAFLKLRITIKRSFMKPE